jgi:tyrosyl-tRNA synthetase
VGGSDQWGNITAGVELVRRVKAAEVHGLVAPLITTAAGAKFGKSEAGAIYLDPALTSPYKFYQFWINTDDRDVERYLKLFSLKSPKELQSLVTEHNKNPAARVAQREISLEVSERVHGDAARSAMAAAEILFGDFDPRSAGASAFYVLGEEIPVAKVFGNTQVLLVDAVHLAGLATSKSEARRYIQQGGIYVNQRQERTDRPLGSGDWLAGGHVLLRRGKKEYALLRVAPS